MQPLGIGHGTRVAVLERFALLNGLFLVVAAAILVWARWRTRPGPDFPGPRPVGPLFKIWLVVIWLVGMVLPVVALAVDGFGAGQSGTRTILGWYVATFLAQVAFEIFVWKRWRSPVWVIVPCLFLPWRLFQVALGLMLLDGPPLTLLTLWALLILWIINVGVHYSNIPNTLRWDAHPRDADFAALSHPNPFSRHA